MSKFVYLSLGAGVQSSALLVMSALGLRDCPKADVAVFADTGDEPAWVYEQVALLTDWAHPHGLEVQTVSAGHLSADALSRQAGHRLRFAAIPVFTLGVDGRAAPMRRQCTNEYKIAPIEKFIRARLGYRPRQRIPAGSAVSLLGISVEEAHRQKPSRAAWIQNRYPLIDAGMTRSACLAVLEEAGLPAPKKSACVFCPYHSDVYWHDLKTAHPDEFQKAVTFDAAIRDMSKQGIRRRVFLHRSLVPLADIPFDAPSPRWFDEGFGNECTGVCGV